MDEPAWQRGDLVMTWREVIIGHGKNKGLVCPDFLRLYVGEIYAGCVDKGDFTPWEAILSDAKSTNLGDFDTQEAAQSALVEAAVKALMGE